MSLQHQPTTCFDSPSRLTSRGIRSIGSYNFFNEKHVLFLRLITISLSPLIIRTKCMAHCIHYALESNLLRHVNRFQIFFRFFRARREGRGAWSLFVGRGCHRCRLEELSEKRRKQWSALAVSKRNEKESTQEDDQWTQGSFLR